MLETIVRQSMDIMTDQAARNIWIIDSDGDNHRPLLSGTDSYESPRWSPDGEKLVLVTSAGPRGAKLHLRWMDTGQTTLLSNLPASPAAGLEI